MNGQRKYTANNFILKNQDNYIFYLFRRPLQLCQVSMLSCRNSLIYEKPYLEIIFYQIDGEMADGSRRLCDATAFCLE